MSEIWNNILGAFEGALAFLHDLVEPVAGVHSWGWAIIMLTLIVRILLLPLAIKQTRSMRAMQKLQPQLKELQKKYKVDRSLLKKDPEQYKAKRQKLNEEMMALYQREGANPAASCLPLVAQAPVFIALFWTLRDADELAGQPFYFFTAVGEGGLEQIVRGAGWPGWLLILLMSGTMFWTMRQMQARQPQMADNPMAQQQKILLYVMPVFLAFISINFPMGVLLYWVTTNIWQIAQQAIILREVKHELEDEAASAGGDGPSGSGKDATSGKPPSGSAKGATSGKAPSGPAKGATSGKPGAGKGASSGAAGSSGEPSDDSGTRQDKAASDRKGGAGSGDKGKKRRPRKPEPRSTNGDAPTDGTPRPIPERPRKRDHLPRRGDRR